ncbi:MAG: fibronectin type III domain-containing protein [Bacteroidaceae bacterium]|nr:fibronectin type III domain-containing protein [Bacteroidaceae bacterium]
MIRLTKKIINTVVALVLCNALSAMGDGSRFIMHKSDILPDDTVTTVTGTLPEAIKDTAEFMKQHRNRIKKDSEARINLLARTYGDSIVLRWASEDYVSWRYLCNNGVNVYRFDKKNPLKVDTLAYALKPATLDVWRNSYPQTDTVAAVAAGTLYGENGFKPEQSKRRPGSLGALLDVYDDQQMRFAVAILTSEWRRDIADKMAMRLVDKTAKKGKEYEYIVRPTVLDTTGHIIFRSGHIQSVKNVKYTPERFDVAIGDSLVGINTVRLWWGNDKRYSSFEIERRKRGEKEWKRVNDRPFVMMRNINDANIDNFVRDVVPSPGTYEYRIFAYDAFGDLTVSSHTHVVTVPDMMAPRAANLTLVVIDRRNPENLSDSIFAEFHYEKDTLEPDFVGYKILYYAPKSDKKRVELTESLIPPTDTVHTVEVTGLTTSQMVVAAYDTAMNVSYSIPRVVRITDVKAPAVPANFRYEIVDNAKGLVRLMWDAPSADVDYYEIVFANDTVSLYTQLATGGLLRKTEFVDTLAVGVNQKYIYYKVRAIDYATNMGEFSKPLQVLRPSLVIPAVPHIDSLWVDQMKGINMRWACSNEQQISHHILKRRVAGTEKWDILGIFKAENVRAAGNLLQLCDIPKYNRRKKYEYVMESVSFAGISSGHSLVLSVKFAGPNVFDWPIKLSGAYHEKNHETRLAWEMNDKLPYEGDWYFCVYRKGKKDDRHKFLMSVKSTERSFSDYLLRPGETAEYYIMIQFEDGRSTKPSNIIKVTAPKEEEKKAE